MSQHKDLVILLPGITGSVLARRGKEVWAPTVGAAWRALVSGGRSITELELEADGIDDGVVATRLVPDVSIVPGLIKLDGYTRIAEQLCARLGLTDGANFRAFPYDWRRDNVHTAERLQSQAMDWLSHWRAVSGNGQARLVLVGHSMGGLIARRFVECLGGWQHTRALVTLGTPHRGALNAVGFLENGMKKGIGPFGLDLSPVLRSFTSVYQLLPIYPCIDAGGGASQRVAEAAEAGLLPHTDAARARSTRRSSTLKRPMRRPMRTSLAVTRWRHSSATSSQLRSQRASRPVAARSSTRSTGRTSAVMARSRGCQRRRSAWKRRGMRSMPRRRTALSRTTMASLPT